MSGAKYPPINYCRSEKGKSHLFHKCSYFHCLFNLYLSPCNVFVLEPKDNPLCCCMECLFSPWRLTEHAVTMHKDWISVRSYVFPSLLILAVPINSFGDHFSSSHHGPNFVISYKCAIASCVLFLPRRDLRIRFRRPTC